MSVPPKSRLRGGNLFELPEKFVGRDVSPGEEFVESLLPDRGILVERIVSRGHSSPPGFWYDQDRDEWVALLSGEAVLEWEDGCLLKMRRGDWILLRAHERHRVAHTSSEPPCVWLALHGRMEG